MIVSKCPLRVSLVGGSTDLQSFINKFGVGKVINFPVDLFTYIFLSSRFDKKYVINYSRRESTSDIEKIKNDIAREIIKYFNLPPITMTFNSDIPTTGSGLASSSSYTVAAVAAACKFKNINKSQFEICEIAHEIELKFNPLTGYQDTYGCGLPSSKLMTFNNDISTKYIKLPTINMFLYNTNIKRPSTDILKTIDIDKSYHLLDLVEKTYKSLSNIDNIWKILNDSWDVKKTLSSHIMNNKIITLENNLRDQYNIKYLKLCGAGGGGYFLIMSEDNIPEAIKINIDNKGVIVWKM